MSDEKKPPDLGVIDGGKKSKFIPKNPRNEITRQTYDDLVDAWTRGSRTILSLMRRTGIGKKTAIKARDRGWPDRGWRALKDLGREYDAVQDAARQPPTLTTEQVEEAATWNALRRQHLELALAIRSVLAGGIVKLQRAIQEATATTTKAVRQVVYEELLDDKGSIFKRVPRTVTVDVAVAPDLVAVMGALNAAAATLARTGSSEIGMANSTVPDWMAAKGVKGMSQLSPEDLDYITKHNRLPPGVVFESLFKG